MNDDGTKTFRYREALLDMGLGTTLQQFTDYCKKRFGFKDVSQSAFYAVRKELREAARNGSHPPDGAPGVTPPQPPAAAAPPPGPSVALGELPALVGHARGLLARFGGDREALARFLDAL